MAMYDSKNGDLFARWKAAYAFEQEAAKKATDYMASGRPDPAVAMALAQAMNDAHARTMELYQELQQYRLD